VQNALHQHREIVDAFGILAHRLDLLDEIDRVFRVSVPQSVPEVLV
jgi:hypothetical protein